MCIGGQEALSEGHKCVGEMRVGWGVSSWTIVRASRVEGGKGFACALSKGFSRMLTHSHKGLGASKGN
jgi:hypothetical protein